MNYLDCHIHSDRMDQIDTEPELTHMSRRICMQACVVSCILVWRVELRSHIRVYLTTCSVSRICNQLTQYILIQNPGTAFESLVDAHHRCTHTHSGLNIITCSETETALDVFACVLAMVVASFRPACMCSCLCVCAF